MLLFESVNENLVLGSIFLIGGWTTCILLRILYLFSDTTSLLSLLPSQLRLFLPSASFFPASFRLPPHLTLVLYGQRVVRALSIAYLLVTLFLVVRVNVPISSSTLFSLDETPRGYWALVRLLLAGLLTLLCSVLDTHFLLRWLTAALIPPAVLLDILSQVALTIALSCPAVTVVEVLGEAGYTEACDPALLDSAGTLTLFAWRDVVGSTVGLLLLGTTYWMIGLLGWASDEVVIWSFEYQQWAVAMRHTRRWQSKPRKRTEPLLSSLFA